MNSLWDYFFEVLLNLLAQSSTAAAVCENKTLQKADLSYNEIGLEGAKNIGYCVCENQDFTESGSDVCTATRCKNLGSILSRR